MKQVKNPVPNQKVAVVKNQWGACAGTAEETAAGLKCRDLGIECSAVTWSQHFHRWLPVGVAKN